MKTLFVYVPDDLHEKFKIKIIKEKTTMKDVILTFLSLYASEDKIEKTKKQEPKKDNKKNEK